MPWAAGTYTRGYPSWSADAAGNLPISATKFDTEDNDFATGINFCLAKDGSNSPTAALSWSLASGQPLALTRTTTDGNVFSLARTGGANNPNFTFAVGDTSGLTIKAVSGGITMLAAGNLSVAAPSSGIALTLTAAASAVALLMTASAGQAGAQVTGTDIGSLVINSSAATNRSQVIFGNSAAIARIGADGTQSMLSDSTNGDLCLVSAGQAVRIGVAAGGTTRVRVASSGAVTIAAPTAATALAITGDGANAPLTIAAAAFTRALSMDSTSANGVSLLMTNSSATLGQIGSSKQLFAGTLGDFALYANSNFVLGTLTAGIIFTLASAGNVTLAAPNSGISMTINGISGTHSMKHADSAAALFNTGYLEVPQNLQAGTTYTAVLADSGKDIHASNAGAKTFTIPANASVAYPIGTVLTFTNAGAGAMTIAITTDTMNLSPGGTTGSRTLVQFGTATAIKVAATTWYISGSGLT